MPQPDSRATYRHCFADGPGGWYGWNAEGASALEIVDGVAVSRSPWWVDGNHAPPGGGYLHILFTLNTRVEGESAAVGGQNGFIRGGFPTDFTNARLTFRIRGDLDARGAQLVLLVQSDITEPVRTRVNSVLAAQPVDVTPDWSTQTITCAPNNGQWICLGSRHSRMETYGWGPIAPVLRDVTCDIILVLFPLDVVPAEPVPGDPHVLRAGHDYRIDTSRLPSGDVMLNDVTIEFPQTSDT